MRGYIITGVESDPEIMRLNASLAQMGGNPAQRGANGTTAANVYDAIERRKRSLVRRDMLGAASDAIADDAPYDLRRKKALAVALAVKLKALGYSPGTIQTATADLRSDPNQVLGEIDTDKIVNAAADAATGALLPALGSLVAGIFGGGHSQWSAANKDVHDWVTQYAEDAFEKWMEKNHPNDFDDLDKVKALRYVWTRDRDGGWINNYANPTFRLSTNPKMNEAFAAMGIDLPATVARASSSAFSNANQIAPQDIVMLPGGGTPQAPTAAVLKVQDLVNKVAPQVSDATAGLLRQGVAKLVTAANSSGNGGNLLKGAIQVNTLPIAIAAGAVAIALIASNRK